MTRPTFVLWKKLMGWRWTLAKMSARSPFTTVSPISRAKRCRKWNMPSVQSASRSIARDAERKAPHVAVSDRPGDDQATTQTSAGSCIERTTLRTTRIRKLAPDRRGVAEEAAQQAPLERA